MATKLEHCQIHPSPGTTDIQELSLPLTHFDIPFLISDPTQRLIFFDFPTSISHFLENIVPNLKKSLSITLTHFLSLAGNIILPSKSDSPVNRYISGDSVSLTIAQCYKDFYSLTKNHQKLADEFYACVPVLPPAKKFHDLVVFPVIALQITLFPGQGICIGITNSHVIADESSIINFVKTWALANKFGHLMDGIFLPVFDRTLVQDPKELDSRAWNLIKKYRVLPVELPPLTFPINRVRKTFILTKKQVQNLKNYVLANIPDLCYISSFSVICAYFWTCWVKSEASVGKNLNEDEPVYFACGADCRARLVPPLPEAYFGNCVISVIAESRHGLLTGNEGVLIAAESIGKAIQETVYSEKGILESADWPLDFGEFSGKRLISVSGSPRFDVYEVDYGWGRPKKYEFVHIDRENSISICKSREFEGGFEIGLSRPKIEMDAFEAVFYQGLEIMNASP
ncbi:hypothetical protein DH2020_022674 [Rehmannia glutinosa]|uniref:Anthocyanin 5-aromatic acyltransferase n=1 Tax=Rehmannia glutinosa TaxID=99300 RepID=A0ABR0W3U1_REHGL